MNEKIKSSQTRHNDVYIGVDGLVKLGEQSKRRRRLDGHRSINSQINLLLKDKFIKNFKKHFPEGWEIFMSFLAFEAEPPLILQDIKEDFVEKDVYLLKVAKKEGIRYIYERLEKLVKEIEEDEHAANREQQ